MQRKLLVVIRRETVRAVFQRSKKFYDNITDRLRSQTINFAHERHSRLSLRQGYDSIFVSSPKKCVDFPVSQPQTVIYHVRTLLNTYSIGYFTPFVINSVAFSSFFPAAKMSIEVSAFIFI